MSETKKGFNLAEVLSDVSELDTFSVDNREQIEYISIDLIESDSANFYELSEIDALAANIECVGLQQPLRVRQHPTDESMVIIVSGHRRRAALQKLVDDGREDLRDVPCIVDKSTGSAAIQELRLIYANSDTRRMTSADISKQAERIEKLLYQLKEEGYEFPGRMRDHVAEVCKVSKTKLARLKMIREKLHQNWQPAYQEGKLNESVAYALSQLPVEDQLTIWSAITEMGKDFRQVYERQIETVALRFKKIGALADTGCAGGCKNLENKRMKAAKIDSWYGIYCDKCCSKCPDLAKCKYACPQLADKVKQLKADAKAQKQQKKEAEEERQLPLIQQVENLWTRFGTARRDAGKSVSEVCRVLGKTYYSGYDKKLYEDREQCLGEIKPTTSLPYAAETLLSDINGLIKVADLFGVSLDYLLCRTPNPVMNDAAPAAAAISSEDLQPAIWYPASVEPPIGKEIIIVANDGFAEDTRYTGNSLDTHAVTAWPEVNIWTIHPTEESVTLPAGGRLPAGLQQWIPGSVNPPEVTDAVVDFVVKGLSMRKLAYWDGFSWKFSKTGETIDATCVRWYPIPKEGDEDNA